MFTNFSFLLIFILFLLLINKIFIITKKDKKIIAKGLYKTNILFIDILIIYIFSFSYLFQKIYIYFGKTYTFLFPKYIVGFKDMFNYNKLINIYNSLININMQNINHIYKYIHTGLPNVLNIILLSLIFIILIISNSKNKIYQNRIYVYGIGYTFDNIKKFKWSEKKSKNRCGKIIKYYNLVLTVKRKYKIFDEYTKNVTLKIKDKDKDKVNSILNLKIT